MRKPCAGGMARSEPSPSAVEALRRELQDLPSLTRDELRVRWRKLFRGSDPPALPRQLVIRVIAYRLQAKLYGDLDRETIRFLDRIAREQKGRKLRGGAAQSHRGSGWLCLERRHLPQPLGSRPCHHRNQLERPALLRIS
jgi:hypothetical protein